MKLFVYFSEIVLPDGQYALKPSYLNAAHWVELFNLVPTHKVALGQEIIEHIEPDSVRVANKVLQRGVNATTGEWVNFWRARQLHCVTKQFRATTKENGAELIEQEELRRASRRSA